MYYLRQALPLAVDAGDVRTEGYLIGNLGSIYIQVGQPDSALATYRRAVSRLHGTPGESVMITAGLGDVHARLGDPDSAMFYYQRALSVARERNNPSSEAAVLNSIGSLQIHLGQFDSALVNYRRVLDRVRTLGERSREMVVLQNIGTVFGNMGRPDSAEHYLEASYALYKVEGALNELPPLLLNIGTLRQEKGDVEAAIATFREAYRVSLSIRDRNHEGFSLGKLGAAYENLGQTDSALAFYHAARAVLRDAGFREAEASALQRIASVYHRRLTPPRLESAVAHYDSAAAIFAYVRARAGKDYDRLGYGEFGEGLYGEWAAAWLARAGEAGVDPSFAATAALAVVERGRAQALLDVLQGEVSNRVPPGAIAPKPWNEEVGFVREAVKQVGVPVISYLVTDDTLIAWLARPTGSVTIFRTPMGASGW